MAEWKVDRPSSELPAAYRRNVAQGWVVLILFLGGCALLIVGAMTDVGAMMVAPSVTIPAAFIVGKRGMRAENELWSSAEARPAEIVAVKRELEGDGDSDASTMDLLLTLPRGDGTMYRAVSTSGRDAERDAFACPGRKVLARVNPLRPWRVKIDWLGTLETYGSATVGAEGLSQQLTTVTLTCSSCGARLDGLASSAVIRCQYCQTENHVVRS